MIDIHNALSMVTDGLKSVSDTASLDAEVLLCHVLSKSRSHLRAWPEKLLSSEQNIRFQQLFKKRQQGTPIAYIVGYREFWSREFLVTPEVLIPRPDTELLIELSLNILANKKNARVIDLGTGSGAIAVTLAAERPDLKIIATDMSLSALEVAQKNAEKHHIRSIQFIHSDWFCKINSTPFDLIISNPPYIADDDPHLSAGDIQFEPKNALIAADQGLKDIKTICQQARNYLKPDATLLIEHGYNQQTVIQTIFQSFDYTHITPFSDLSANPRVTTGQWQQQ